MSKFVGINTKSALRDEGYTWVPKTRDFTENLDKNSKKSKFLVFLRSTAFSWSSLFGPIGKITLRDESYA